MAQSMASDSDVSDETTEVIDLETISPYQFEPSTSEEPDDVDSDDSDSQDNDIRLMDDSWCLCLKCQAIPTPKECVCF
uniref:Uncharacterized protein n=1 Tax=Amphimedon queenslandica TaxID=400682 RepID=A0A1X7V6M5_AMPQE